MCLSIGTVVFQSAPLYLSVCDVCQSITQIEIPASCHDRTCGAPSVDKVHSLIHIKGGVIIRYAMPSLDIACV